MDTIAQLDRKGLRKFGLVTGTIVALLFGLLLPWLIAVGLWLPALLLPDRLKPIYNGWMRFGMILDWINTRIILGLLFYTLFTPVSLVLKLLRIDSMRRKPDTRAETYRVASKNQPPDHMERPF